MGKITGFLETERQDRRAEPADERTKHWQEFIQPSGPDAAAAQAAVGVDSDAPG